MRLFSAIVFTGVDNAFQITADSICCEDKETLMIFHEIKEAQNLRPFYQRNVGCLYFCTSSHWQCSK